jgi:uncharacterized protein (TIGR03083 family)
VTDPRNTAVVDELDREWASLARLGAELAPEDWDRPTDLPGWSVRDCYSHVVGVERTLLGEPAPEVAVEHLDHVDDPMSALIETWVEARRHLPGPDVLAELAEVAARRLAELRSLDDEAFDRVGWSPIGQVPYRDFMVVRVFDCWMHEQDVRRAVGRPGHLDGPVAARSIGHLRRGLGYVVGKQARAPEGATVVVEVTGPVGWTAALEVVDGRATPVDPPAEPTVTLTIDHEAFAAASGGRWDAEHLLALGRARVAGDRELGHRVLEHLAVTP